MSKHQLSTRGRYLLSGLTLALGLCIVAGGMVNHDTHNAEIEHPANNSFEAVGPIRTRDEVQSTQDLYKRTGSDRVDRKGKPYEENQWLAPQSDDGKGTSVISLQRLQDEDDRSRKSFDEASRSGSSVPPGGDHREYEQRKKLTGNDDTAVPLENHWRRIGQFWKPLFQTLTQDLPLDAKSSIPPGNKPKDYGYKWSEQMEDFPAQLVKACNCLMQKDPTMTEIRKIVNAKEYNVVTWEHVDSTSKSKSGSASGSKSGSPDFPATDAFYRMVTVPSDKLLIADASADPWKRRGEESAGNLALPDGRIVPMAHAADLWHHEWKAACEKKQLKAARLTYLMSPMDPAEDRASIDVFKWAAAQDPRRKWADVQPWPGHVFKPGHPTGIVLLGTPFAQNVARLIVQHKSDYGFDRKIERIRIWRTDTADPEAPQYSILATLSGLEGNTPVLSHDKDTEESPDGSDAELPLETEHKLAVTGSSGEAGTLSRVPAGRRPPAFQVGPSSSSDSESS